MRILWLSPWMRSLARIYIDNLIDLGAEVMFVTADLHPESDHPRPYETVLLGRPVPTADWLPIQRTYREARRFQPDIVVTELLRDPRWQALASLAPRARLIHDANPHDPSQIPPWYNRLFFNRWDERADATIAFSRNVADKLLERPSVSASQLHVAPLTSDLPMSQVPDFVPADKRRNVVLVGRQRPYKNHDVVFQAWEAHTQSPSWPGDELVLFGRGNIKTPLPCHTRWEERPFKYAEIVDEFAHARASIVHSRNASQSGVQLISLQLGVPTLISTAGALPENQPPGLAPIDVDDVEGLTQAMNRLAIPDEIDIQSRNALAHFHSNFEPQVAARRLLEIFEKIRKTTTR